MKRIMAIALTVGLGIGMHTAAMAQTAVSSGTPAIASAPIYAPVHTPKITDRQKDQQTSIKQGIKSDELTRKEAMKLKEGEEKIAAEKKLAKADGTVTPAERAQLNKDLNRESRAIYRLKHNGREAH
jgi:hypothetical protein